MVCQSVRNADESDRQGARYQLLGVALYVLWRARMQARPVYPGTTRTTTRRCSQRKFLMRPDASAVQIFLYCLGEAALKFGVTLILPTMMSNHEHIATYDPHGLYIEFKHRFHTHLARAMNAMRGHRENFWNPQGATDTEIVSSDAFLKQLVYIAMNPVKAHLVERVADWPGFNFVEALLDGRMIRVERPKKFFSSRGDMPDVVEFKLEIPPGLFGDPAELLAELRMRIREEEDALIAERRKSGRRVLGAGGVLRQRWQASPATEEARTRFRPRIAAGHQDWARVQTIERNKAFERAYREARKRWLAGEDVEFPYGTYWLRRFANVRVTAAPPRMAIA